MSTDPRATEAVEPGQPGASTPPALDSPVDHTVDEPGFNGAAPRPTTEDEHDDVIARVREAEPDGDTTDAVKDTADGVPATGADPELAALIEKAAKADEYLELAQRTKADFENYRKRAAREAAAAQERGIAKLARELLAAVDNLDRALVAAEAQPATAQASEEADPAAQLISGIRLVHADVIAAFARVGIEPFSPIGEPFDPQYHEAVAQQPFEGAEPGTVVECYQLGYKLGDVVLRPARVMVAA
jgi:molecular chaperone GrpE